MGLLYHIRGTSFHLISLMEAVRMVAPRREFKENPESIAKEIGHIKVWLSKQPLLPRITDEEVHLFLHGCKYEVESTKNVINNYFTIRTMVPEVFSNRIPSSPEVREVLDTVAMGRLSEKSLNGYDVFISKLRRTDPEFYKCQLPDILKVYTMHTDLCWKERSPGILYLIDIKGFVLTHSFKKVNLKVLMSFINYVQAGLPIRLRGILFLNCPPFIETIANMVKPVIQPELFNLLHFYQAHSEKLYDHIPKSILPEDYGGNAENMEKLTEETFKILLEHEQWFEEDEHRRVDESKRQGEPRLKNDRPFAKHFSFFRRSIDFD